MNDASPVKRIQALRAAMKTEKVDAMIIPTADYHGSEYVAACFRAREYFSGFTGSAGTLLVLADSAFLWTDGRYFIQAERELEGSGIALMRMGTAGVPSISEYLWENLGENATIAFDGRCMTVREGRDLEERMCAKRICVRTDLDPAKMAWPERPTLPSHPVWILDAESFAGESAQSKLKKLRGKMARQKATAYVTGRLDEIMWLYNLRGNDVECNPVALSYTVVTKDSALLYLQEAEVTGEVRKYLGEIGAELHPYEDFFEDLGRMRFDAAAGDCTESSCPLPNPSAVRIWFDPEAASYAIYDALWKNLKRILGLSHETQELYVNAAIREHLIEKVSPLLAMKAIRNETEIRNFKSCYLEDSAVLTKFIFRLKKAVSEGCTLTERDASDMLDGMRAEISDFVELSFGTISAYGSNAAMMHYEPGEDGGAVLRPEGMYLVDSGAHYLRGTTDVTRTLALGPGTEEMRRDYTLTAISHFRMMDVVFLKGCNGMALDIMAREPMWRNGMNYQCGTGHGIGYLLNVHEGPQCLRFRSRETADTAPFEPGMIISDEPGVYKSGRRLNQDLPIANPCAGLQGTEGAHGIRIETILLTREWGTTADGEFLCFEPITFVPLDPALIDPSLLDSDTRESLNRYHRAVLEKLSPFMEEEELSWLKEQCKAI